MDTLQCVNTEANGFFPIIMTDISEYNRLDYPKEIPINGYIAYWRKELVIPTKVLEIKKSFTLPYHGDQYFQGNVKRAMQNALIGQITPNIREIHIEPSEERLFVVFYNEGEIKECDIKNMHEIMDLFCKSFPQYYKNIAYNADILS